MDDLTKAERGIDWADKTLYFCMPMTKLTQAFAAEEGNDTMSIVKMLRGGQITLPAEIRRALELGEGDHLEAEMVAGAVVLKPKTLVDREQAWERLMRIVERPKWRGRGPEPGEDELMEEVVEDIHAMRRAYEGRSR